jgi:xanthine dehydrogenase YagS FAD-binding subunit
MSPRPSLLSSQLLLSSAESRRAATSIQFNNTPYAIVHPSTPATALVALGATVELTNAVGVTRRLMLEDFFVPVERDLQRENDIRPQQILTAIVLPKPAPSTRMAHIKQGDQIRSTGHSADVAVVFDLDAGGICKSPSIVLGAAAPVPHRARAAETALSGKPIDEDTATQAAPAALAGATPLSKNAYKLPLFETLVRRALLKAIAGT